MTSSKELGRFASEQEHHYDDEMGRAAIRWRASTQSGAFSGWNVRLFVDSDKLPSFARVIRAAGGRVVDSDEPIENITHSFVQSRHKASSEIELLREHDIPIIESSYINLFVVSSPNLEEIRIKK